jgi:hypothetical protein
MSEPVGPDTVTRAVEGWRQAGRVCLWRYKPIPKIYAGWHFSADAQGCDSLLDLLARMRSASGPAHRTVMLSDPRRWQADQIFGEHALKVRFPAKLRLEFDPAGSRPDPMTTEIDDRLVLGLGPGALEDFSGYVAEVRDGGGDFGIGLDPGSDMKTMMLWWLLRTGDHGA